MPDAPMPLPPGSLTVPPWSGWEAVAMAVALLLVAGVVFLLIGAARASAGGRDEWRALLEARSSRGGPGEGRQDRRQPVDVPSR